MNQSTAANSALREISVVVIGRNEGERLIACLRSVDAGVRRIVYVDSGSSDGSVEAARKAGAAVVQLDTTTPFTAARARNAGFQALAEAGEVASYVQFIDGDCILHRDWLVTAHTFISHNTDVAAVCGRRREQFPERSVFNLLCDLEWHTPVGPAQSFGGDVLLRTSAFQAAAGYRNDLICGEEPELCIRLRQAGWKIFRVDAEMTSHDANMSHMSQWWRRCVRGGYGYAKVYDLYRNTPHVIWRPEVLRAVLYGGIVPVVAMGLAWISLPLSTVMLMVYPIQITRIALKRGVTDKASWFYGAFTILAKFPELQGVLKYVRDRINRRASPLIEYKVRSQ